MDLVILEKIESSILNGLGYIVRLEKKSGNNKQPSINPYIIGFIEGFLLRYHTFITLYFFTPLVN